MQIDPVRVPLQRSVAERQLNTTGNPMNGTRVVNGRRRWKGLEFEIAGDIPNALVAWTRWNCLCGQEEAGEI